MDSSQEFGSQSQSSSQGITSGVKSGVRKRQKREAPISYGRLVTFEGKLSCLKKVSEATQHPNILHHRRLLQFESQKDESERADCFDSQSIKVQGKAQDSFVSSAVMNRERYGNVLPQESASSMIGKPELAGASHDQSPASSQEPSSSIIQDSPLKSVLESCRESIQGNLQSPVKLAQNSSINWEDEEKKNISFCLFSSEIITEVMRAEKKSLVASLPTLDIGVYLQMLHELGFPGSSVMSRLFQLLIVTEKRETADAIFEILYKQCQMETWKVMPTDIATAFKNIGVNVPADITLCPWLSMMRSDDFGMMSTATLIERIIMFLKLLQLNIPTWEEELASEYLQILLCASVLTIFRHFKVRSVMQMTLSKLLCTFSESHLDLEEAIVVIHAANATKEDYIYLLSLIPKSGSGHLLSQILAFFALQRILAPLEEACIQPDVLPEDIYNLLEDSNVMALYLEDRIAVTSLVDHAIGTKRFFTAADNGFLKKIISSFENLYTKLWSQVMAARQIERSKMYVGLLNSLLLATSRWNNLCRTSEDESFMDIDGSSF